MKFPLVIYTILFCVFLISGLIGDDDDGGMKYIELPEAQHSISSILCIIKFCEKYFRSEKAVIGSLVIVNTQNMTEFHSELIIMLNEHANYDLGVMTKDATKPHGNPLHVVDKAKNYFVVFSKTTEIIDAINQWNRLPTWNPLAQVVALFVNVYDDNELFVQMKSILQLFLNRHMIYVNVISYRYNSSIVQAHTFYPYYGDNCAKDVVDLHLIEECEYSDETPFDPIITVIDELKPKIPNDLHGCEIHISSSIIEPFVFIDEESNSFDIGLEVLMIRTIAQALKMTPVFVRNNNTRENRVVSNDTGIYANLLTQKSDILIGGMDNDARVQKMLWVTIPYIQDDQTWCVATARPQDLWQNIFGIYTVSTWASLIAAIFFNAFIIYLFIRAENKTESYVWTLMIGLASALGQYATYDPQRISIRMMMIFLFAYGIVMSSSFNSFLIGILTRPRFKQQISSVEMAIRYDFKFTGGEVALSHYLGNDTISLQVRKNFEICYYTDECLKRLQYDDKLAVAVSRLHAENTPAITRSDMFCFPRSKNIYSYSIAMPIKLDYHMLPLINYNIRQLFEFGLTERWNKLSQAIAANEEIKKTLEKVADGKDSRVVVLTVPHIMGALLIMAFGHIVAMIAFLTELAVERKTQKNKRTTKVWILLDRFLKPK